MDHSYVLISTKNSYEHDVAKRLSLIDEVIEVHPLISEESTVADPFFEEYSLIAKINLNGKSKNIGMFVDKKIHTVKGITKTKIV